jgi:FkbM family methyltransferase
MTLLNWEYEKEEREMLLSLAKDGDTFFDIGANAGLYSITFAKRYPKSRVYAFEPIPVTIAELESNLELNGVENVTICPYGLSDKSDHATFYYAASDSGATSMAPIGERFGPTVTTVASVSDLDSVCGNEGGFHPDIIKCDVEGAELLVFKGAAKTLETYKPVIQCEMLRKWAKRFNYHPNDIIKFLGEIGYNCYFLKEGSLQPFTEMTDETVETNFFFIHP